MTPTPAAPEKVTRIAYWVAFGVAAAALIIDGIAKIWWPEAADRLIETTAVVIEAALFIAAGLGAIIQPWKRKTPGV